MNDTAYVVAIIVALALVTVVNRGFFFLSRRELPLPSALQRGLRYAPLAALMAVVSPEVVTLDAAQPWRDARPWAALAAAVYGGLRKDILGTIVLGMAVLWTLHFGLGW
jgi:branched-subunit amino acid transport protein